MPQSAVSAVFLGQSDDQGVEASGVRSGRVLSQHTVRCEMIVWLLAADAVIGLQMRQPTCTSLVGGGPIHERCSSTRDGVSKLSRSESLRVTRDADIATRLSRLPNYGGLAEDSAALGWDGMSPGSFAQASSAYLMHRRAHCLGEFLCNLSINLHISHKGRVRLAELEQTLKTGARSRAVRNPTWCAILGTRSSYSASVCLERSACSSLFPRHEWSEGHQ